MFLGTVVALTKRIRACEGSLRIVCPSARMRAVFAHSGLADSYEFYESPQEAANQPPAPAVWRSKNGRVPHAEQGEAGDRPG